MGCKYRKIIRISKMVRVKDEENDAGYWLLDAGYIWR